MAFRINYSIVFVSDMNRSVKFYRDTIGIPLKFESPGWSEFVTDGATLALHSADSSTAEASGVGSNHPGQCRAGFQVPDLNAFHRRMLEHDVQCVQDPTETFGIPIAQYVDPDGLVFSVSGNPTQG